jgi:hypothetical protein
MDILFLIHLLFSLSLFVTSLELKEIQHHFQTFDRESFHCTVDPCLRQLFESYIMWIFKMLCSPPMLIFSLKG